MEKLSDPISKTIQRNILRGILSPGTRLPSERALSEQFKVSRVTVREAIEKLRQFGLVEKRPNSGSYVCDLNASASVSLLTEIMSQGETVDADILVSLMEFREIVEVYVAGRAAQRASREDIQELKSIVSEMKRQAEDIQTLPCLNVDLHTKLNRLSGNLVLCLLFNSFQPIYHYYMEYFHRLPDASSDIIEFYLRLVAAIESGDNRYAAHIMEELLHYGHNRMKDSFGLSENGKKVQIGNWFPYT